MKQAISVGARSSPLSLVQVDEVLHELRIFNPDVEFQLTATETIGDKDRTTSLKTLEKSNFFTKEVDDLLLSGKCRIAIHSAKDLPDPLPKGLSIVALTYGVDSSDSLVLREGDSLLSLPIGAKIATSSQNREENVKKLRHDFTFQDIRGTISERLAKLDTFEADGVVIAEAALLRLKLSKLNRVKIPGTTTPLQGQLAILARSDDTEMEQLFAPLDVRRCRTLYFGLDLPKSMKNSAVHYPLIEIIPNSRSNPDIENTCQRLHQATHVIFTSKTAVKLFLEYVHDYTVLMNKTFIAVGKETAKLIQSYGLNKVMIAIEEQAEGVIHLLDGLNLEEALVLWPHAAKARPLISDYMKQRGISFCECDLYDTLSRQVSAKPNLHAFHEVHFTSPSTVDAFFEVFHELPAHLKVHCIGSITNSHLNHRLGRPPEPSPKTF